MRQSETHGVDDYLEAIYELQEEGQRVVQAGIARRLGVARATVSEQIGRLQRMKLVELREREIVMTEDGSAMAEDAVRRHRLAERFLTDVLRMPWHLVHQEANRFQSGITADIEKRMLHVLDGAVTCPHGNPIPGTGASLDPALRPLNEFTTGARVTLVRLLEDVELDTETMRYLEEQGLVPGAEIEITGTAPDGTMSLSVASRPTSVGKKLTDNLWVRPAAAPASSTFAAPREAARPRPSRARKSAPRS